MIKLLVKLAIILLLWKLVAVPMIETTGSLYHDLLDFFNWMRPDPR